LWYRKPPPGGQGLDWNRVVFKAPAGRLAVGHGGKRPGQGPAQRFRAGRPLGPDPPFCVRGLLFRVCFPGLAWGPSSQKALEKNISETKKAGDRHSPFAEFGGS